MTDLARALSDGARYVRMLGKADLAFALDNQSELDSIFAGVDPIDVEEVASILQTLALHFEDSRDDPTGTSVATPQSAVPATTSQSPERSSSSRVTFLHEPPAHPGWSVRCS